ncbi:MAG: prepilin-type N-terminal cleavage/methylation domain-containing protein [Candidatus Omnitrophota bacterium]
MKFSSRAFSLVELMVGVIILLFVISGCLMTYIHCVVLNDSSQNLAVAINDAQYVLEQMRSLAFGNIATYVAPVFSNLPSEAITLNRIIGASMATITVQVSWQERQRSRTFSITTYVAK